MRVQPHNYTTSININPVSSRFSFLHFVVLLCFAWLQIFQLVRFASYLWNSPFHHGTCGVFLVIFVLLLTLTFWKREAVPRRSSMGFHWKGWLNLWNLVVEVSVYFYLFRRRPAASIMPNPKSILLKTKLIFRITGTSGHLSPSAYLNNEQLCKFRNAHMCTYYLYAPSYKESHAWSHSYCPWIYLYVGVSIKTHLYHHMVMCMHICAQVPTKVCGIANDLMKTWVSKFCAHFENWEDHFLSQIHCKTQNAY